MGKRREKFAKMLEVRGIVFQPTRNQRKTPHSGVLAPRLTEVSVLRRKARLSNLEKAGHTIGSKPRSASQSDLARHAAWILLAGTRLRKPELRVPGVAPHGPRFQVLGYRPGPRSNRLPLPHAKPRTSGESAIHKRRPVGSGVATWFAR
jgi:hypothetical protein